MTDIAPIWITPRAHHRLSTELAKLTRLRETTSSISGVLNDRIHQIHELLRTAVVGETPPDDGIAEPGMVLTVRFDDTGDIETFLLAVRDAEDGDMETYSMYSPLGTAIFGAKPGEQRSYRVPSGATVQVTLLDAVPYGLHDPSQASGVESRSVARSAGVS